jgi:hypothetical protein
MIVRMAQVALVAFAVGGCGNDANVTLGGSTAQGSVGGVVLDAAPGLPPLAGATISVVAGGQTFSAMTDMNGTFGINGVPSGSVVVKISAADHFDAFVTGTLASSAGNFPVANASLTIGPIAVVSNKGTMTLRLVDENGAPAKNVKATARIAGTWLDFSLGVSNARGGTVATGTSSMMDGTLVFSGVPDFASIGPILTDLVTVNIPPQKLAGADDYEFLGLTLNINATQYSPSLGQTPTIVLAGPRSGLSVLASNVDFFETGQAGPTGSQVTDSVTIAFNQAVNAGSFRAQLLDENGAADAAMAMATPTGNLVNITFSKALAPGARYNLAVHADSNYGDQTHEYNQTAPFFVPQVQGTAVTVANASHMDPNGGNDYDLIFSEPVGVGGGRGDAIPCVVYYDTSLDGNAQVVSPGEWTSGGNNLLQCVPNDGHLGYYLRPAEPIGPLSGFTTSWRIAVREGTSCTNAAQYLCNTSGVTVHLQFSRETDPSYVVKKSNGTPLPDITFTLPSF